MLSRTTGERGVSPFSADFVWSEKYAALRFSRVLMGNDGPQSLLEAVLRTELTDEDRANMFPTPLDLGTGKESAPADRTYQAIADVVARQTGEHQGAIGDEYVKSTAKAIAQVTGFPYAAHRNQNADIAARVLKLFVYMKRARSSSLLSMIEAPEEGRLSSLELTNPYPLGVENQKRHLYADLKAYVSAEIEPCRRREIDTVFLPLRECLDSFLDELLWRTCLAPGDDGRQPTVDESIRRTGRASIVLAALWGDEIDVPSRSLLRLDEQVYVHLLSLDFVHYAQSILWVRSKLPARRAIRPSAREIASVRTCIRPEHFKEEVGELGPLKWLLEIATRAPVDQAAFEESAKLAGSVLGHYLGGLTIDPDAEADSLLATACLCVALDLKEGRVPDFKPYVHGQGGIGGSVRAAIRSGVNEKHEEFERICTEMVDWYRADLLGQTALHQAREDLRYLVAGRASRICLSHDTDRLGTFLDSLSLEATLDAWRAH